MKQIDEIRRVAKGLTGSTAEDMNRYMAYVLCKCEVPRLCDALEFLILELEVDGGYVDEVERILEGKE